MRGKQPIALILTLMLCLSLAGQLPAAYAAEQTTSRPMRSELTVQNAKPAYGPGDTVTLQLAVTPQDAGTFTVRGYDNSIELDTMQLTLVSAAASEACKSKTKINPDAEASAGTKQRIQWTYLDYEGGATLPAQNGTLVLGTITVKINDGILSGESVIRQTLGGVYDADGSWYSSVDADPATLSLKDGKNAYSFGMELTAGAKNNYQAGDEITVTSYLTTSGISCGVAGAATQILLDSSKLELVSYSQINAQQVGTGTETAGKLPLNIMYLSDPPDSSIGQRLDLARFVLRIKEGAAAGPCEISQTNTAVNISSSAGAASQVGRTELSLRLSAGDQTCQFLLAPTASKVNYEAGDELKVDLVLTTDKPSAPRMIGSEIGYREDTFEFVTASAVDAKMKVNGGAGTVKWIYYNDDTNPAALAARTTLGSLTLRVKTNAPAGTAVISQLDANLYGADGAPYDVTAYDDMTVVVINRQQGEPSVTPETASYDKYTATDGLSFTLNAGGYTFTGISAEGTALSPSTDYTVGESGEVQLAKSWLDGREPGSCTLFFEFGEKTKSVSLTVEDSTPPPPEATYSLLVTANYGSMGTVEGSGSYEAGSTVSLKAAPKAGYRFLRWEVRNNVGTVADASAKETAFTMPAGSAMVTAVFASDSTRIYEAVLTKDGADATIAPGESVTVKAQLRAQDGKNYRVRLLEETIAVDTSRFEITGLTAQAGAILTTQAGVSAGQELVRIFYSSQSQTAMTGSLELGTIALKVKVDAAEGTVELLPTVLSLSDGDELDPARNVTASALTVTVSEPPAPASYRVTAEANIATMGTVTGSGEYQVGDRVQLTAAAKNGYRFVRWELPAGVELESGSVTAPAIAFSMPERDARITAFFVSADTRSYEALVKTEGEKEVYRQGDQLLLTVQAKAGDDLPYGIRMLETNLSMDSAVFEVTSTAGIGGAIVTVSAIGSNEGNGGADVRIYYYNANAQETAAGPTDLAVILLTVKADAPTGGAVLTQTVVGFVDAKGDDLTGNVISSGADFVIEEATKGVTVSGTVSLTDSKADVSKTTVLLTSRKIDGAAAAYGCTAQTGDYEVTVSADGSYTIENVVRGSYTMLIRKPGALYYQKNNLTVTDSAIAYKEITLLLGDLNMDGMINTNDKGLLLSPKNINMSADQAELSIADLNDDGSINTNDKGILLSPKNINQSAQVEK